MTEHFIEMTSEYKILLNDGTEHILTQEMFEKLPEESMLQALLKEDQPMSTKNGKGQYELTLDHPKLFPFVLQELDKGQASPGELHETCKEDGDTVIETMQNYVDLADYLGITITGAAAKHRRLEGNSYKKRLLDFAMPHIRTHLASCAYAIYTEFTATLDNRFVAFLRTLNKRTSGKADTPNFLVVDFCINEGLLRFQSDYLFFTYRLNQPITLPTNEIDMSGYVTSISYAYAVWLADPRLFYDLLNEYLAPVFVRTLEGTTGRSIKSSESSVKENTANGEKDFTMTIKIVWQ